MHTTKESQAWIRRYYPEPAINFRDLDTKIPKREAQLRAAKHSLRKWVGLRQHRQRNNAPIAVDGSTCALCQLALDSESDTRCEQCPLDRVRDEVACDDLRVDEAISPFHHYTLRENPEVMIGWLRLTVRVLVRELNPEHRRILPEVTVKTTLHER